jgi:uncharacterized surface protein with fasciclin (FAS1) repeats
LTKILTYHVVPGKLAASDPGRHEAPLKAKNFPSSTDGKV